VVREGQSAPGTKGSAPGTKGSAPGTKGVVDHVTIAISSAGAFQAAVMCFRAWLGRDRDRRIQIRWDDGGGERLVTLTGEAVDAETVREIAKAAAGQLGASPWPAGTEHC
jgi:membrane-associated two-gene conflict system component 1 (EACC1)